MKKTLMKFAALASVLVMMLALTSCGSDDTLLVVTEATFPPFDTIDDDGNIAGFDMDLMNAIAEDQGFKVEYKDIGFDSLIPALEADEADIIAAGMNSLDPERQAKVDFSTPYFDSQLVLVVADSNTTINSVADLKPDMKVAGQIGTTGADEANALEKDGKIAKAVILDKVSDAMLQLQNGDIDAIILDKPVTESYIAKQPGIAKIVGSPIGELESYAFAVQKGNEELLEKINTGLKNMIENGTYDELVAKWF
ncbi:MAG: basic amino acid ABC transporter substrate-binding protein [Clostridiales bacterium]|nr:basic amino acid ABC transporter substrate-binding protein [Candidatus Crickella merdequi]